MNILWPGLFIVVSLLIANADGRTAAKSDQKTYMQVLVSQGQLIELQREEDVARQALANVTSELSALESKKAKLGNCDAGKKNEKPTVIQNLISQTNEKLNEAGRDTESLRNSTLNIDEKMRTSLTKKEELTLLGQNLTSEGVGLQKKVDSAKDAYAQHVAQRMADDDNGTAYDMEETLLKKVDELQAERNKHNKTVQSNIESLSKVKNDMKELSVERDNLKKKEDDLGNMIEAALGRLQKLEVRQADMETKGAMEITQQKNECENKMANTEKMIREKESEMVTSKKVLRMKEAKTRWMHKQVTETLKKLEEMKRKKEQEERENGKQIQ